MPGLVPRSWTPGDYIDGTQCAVQPPSTGNAAPVIEAPASVLRNRQSAPSSSTVANFLFHDVLLAQQPNKKFATVRNRQSAPSSSTVANFLFGCWARSTSWITLSRGIP